MVTAIVATLIPSALVLASAYANWKTDKVFICKIENDRLVYDPPTRFSCEFFSIELDQIKKVERDDGVYKIVSVSGEEFSVFQHYGFYFSDLLNEIESRIGRRLEA